MRICVMGLGYIGLPTACLLATKGFEVWGVDTNADVVSTINHGKIHITEPDLDVLVRSAIGSGKLTAATVPQPADIFLIAVPTPFKEEHEPDLSYIEAAVAAIAPHLVPGNLILLESTSPVGTTESISHQLSWLRPDLTDFPKVHIAYCPERVLPGQIIKELIDNDRIVGGLDKDSTCRAKSFYESFVNGMVIATDARTAEMCKLAENAFRDVNIAFANELSLLCEKMGVNVWNLIELANRHPRVNILRPGPGVGGHCIAVDPWFLVHSAPELARLLRTARQVNDCKPEYITKNVEAAAIKMNNPMIACLGLSFKADVGDLRESPAIHIVRALSKQFRGRVVAVEPYLSSIPSGYGLEDVCLDDLDSALCKADIVVLLVDHKKFRAVDRCMLHGKTVIDTRGLWQP